MSDIPADYRDRLNIREQIERIDRQRAESQKFIAEQLKLGAEQQKLMAVALKLNRDRWLAPWILAASLSSGIIVAVISHFWK